MFQFHRLLFSLVTTLLSVAVLSAAGASEIVRGEFKSDLVPQPTPYAVLLPDGYREGPPLPLLVMLHGAHQDREFLATQKDLIDAEWKTGRLRKMVIAMPSAAPFGFYMDTRDGNQKWETLIAGPFRRYIQETYNASIAPKENLLMGGSMGGEGTLRIGLKYPERFAAIAALEPGLQPVFHWSDVTPRMRYWITDAQYEAVYGKPFDVRYWEANSPVTLAKQNRDRILSSGLKIYLDVGDDDSLFLYDGVEFFHRLLWDEGIKHEYHLVDGADHVGRSLSRRGVEALEFLSRALEPVAADPDADAFRSFLAPMRKQAGIP